MHKANKTMTIFHTPYEWQKIRPNGTIGFVPTMGALHEGHLELVRTALKECDHAVVSIYVNPTQFNNPEDFEKYPSTLDEDCKMLEAIGCQFVFAPTYPTLYPDGYRYRVTETETSRLLEGAHRPGHFDGVLTVVLKLFNIMGADAAFFGEKDYQQLILVKEMAESLHHPTKVVPCPTIREADGLAMSSRNRRLNPAQRALAAQWARILADTNLSCEEATQALLLLGFTVDYVAEHWGRRLGAVHTPPLEEGPIVRLIDNIAL
jgi:pantoate--beta-alanine ligase